MKIWHKLKMRSQILIYFILTTGIVIFIMGSFLFYNSSKIMAGEAEKTITASIEKSGKQVEMYLNKLNSLSELLTQTPQVCRYFSKDMMSDAYEQDYLDSKNLVNILIKTNPEIKSIIMVGADGRIITNEENLDMNFAGNVKDQTWYKDALKSTEVVLTSARMQEFSMNKNDWVISLTREIKGSAGESLGILRIDFKYSEIEKILNNLMLGKTGFAFIMNEHNQLVYHPDPSYFENNERIALLSDIIAPHESSKPKGTSLTEGTTLTYIYKVAGSDWKLVGVSSMDGLVSMKMNLLRTVTFMGILIFLGAFLVSRRFSNNLSRPLSQLEKAMERMENDFQGIDHDKIGSAEIASLMEKYVLMVDEIRNLMEEIKNKEKTLRDSEIRTLQSQINPHFLYNTLDTIVWLAEFGEVEKVVRVSKALGSFFRLSLHGGQENIPVRDEIDHVKQYLLIQKERYLEKLEYEITVDENALDIEVPKIILQPIIENSIYHGIRHLEGNGLIKISATKEKNRLVFVVEDNGVGFDQFLMKDIEKQPTISGIGLSNVKERLRLLCGEDFVFEINSRVGEGTVVRIELPC